MYSCIAGINDWDDFGILSQVLATSQAEYLESLKRQKDKEKESEEMCEQWYGQVVCSTILRILFLRIYLPINIKFCLFIVISSCWIIIIEKKKFVTIEIPYFYGSFNLAYRRRNTTSNLICLILKFLFIGKIEKKNYLETSNFCVIDHRVTKKKIVIWKNAASFESRKRQISSYFCFRFHFLVVII